MEIPDISYDKPVRSTKSQEILQFESQCESEGDPQNILDPAKLSYEATFRSILQDEIYKKTLNISWHKRYFCLTETRLIYYTDSTKQEMKGCFNLASLAKHLIILEVRDQEKTLRLTVFDKQNVNSCEDQPKQLISLSFHEHPVKLDEWKKQLNLIIRNLSSSVSNFHTPSLSLTKIMNGDIFWNQLQITNAEFSHFANHLDILFFRSKKPIASFHRLFMRSNYDHVALILKDEANRILVLEAIQSRGVWINQWEQMMPIFKEHYEEISYRKLLLSPDQKLNFQKLEQLLDKIIGRKYELSLSKLFVGEDSEITEPEANQTERASRTKTKQKTYFCSELIADVYIKLGLISNRKRNQFWPRDFQHELTLNNGAVLSPLMSLSI